MLAIELPGQPTLMLEHVVMDFNGTLALQGVPVAGIEPRLKALAEKLELHCITGDTYGTARQALADLPLNLHILPATGQSTAKQALIESLQGAVCAIGNGWNDRLMLARASLPICIMMNEGASAASLQAARVVFPSILDALNALLYPKRMVALLRD